MRRIVFYQFIGLSIIGLMLGCTLVASIMWIWSSKWFTNFWWFHVALVASCLMGSNFWYKFNCEQKIRLYFKRIRIKVSAKISQRINNHKHIISLYYLSGILKGCGVFSWIILQLPSSYFYYQEKLIVSYLISWLSIIPFSLFIGFSKLTKDLIIRVERKMAVDVLRVNNQQLGWKLYNIFGSIRLLSIVVLISLLICMLVIFFSNDYLISKYIIIYSAIAATFIGVTWVIRSQASALLASTVLNSQEVEHSNYNCLLLRPFSGDLEHKHRELEEICFCGGLMNLGLKEEEHCWLTAVRPGEHFVTPGVQRVALSDENWQQWIENALGMSNIIAIVTGDTESLNWEVSKLAEKGYLSKLRIICIKNQPVEESTSFFYMLCDKFGIDLAKPDFDSNLAYYFAYWWENGYLKEERILPTLIGPAKLKGGNEWVIYKKQGDKWQESKWFRKYLK